MRQLKIAKSITQRSESSLEKYLQEISKMEMVTSEEEIDLAIKIRNGDERALNKLVNANLRFVVSVAKQYQNNGLLLADIINEGNCGLIKAAQRFDETKGFKFISYAVWWIRQSILQALAEQGRLIRLPLNKIGIHNRVNKACLTFLQDTEREPSVEELAELLEMEENDVSNIFRSNIRHVSLDAPTNESETVTLGDTIDGGMDTSGEAMKDSLRDEIQRVFKSLTPREADILSAHFRFDGDQSLSTEQLMQKYHLKSLERIRQIRIKALGKMKQRLRSKLLKSYLG